MESTPAEALLQQVTATALRLFEAAACSIALLDDEDLVFVHASGEGADSIVGTRLPLTRGIAGWALSSGQPVAVTDVQSDPRWARDVAESTGYIPRTIVAAPLQTERDAYGVLSVLDPAVTGGIAERLLELVALFAQQAAATVELAELSQGADGDDARSELTTLVRGLSEEQVAAVTEIVQTFVRYSSR